MTVFRPFLKNVSLRSLGGGVILIPVATVIGLALWLSYQAVSENMHFAHATGQVINLVGAARDYAKREESFSLQPGEDVLLSLAREGAVNDVIKDTNPAHLSNAWGGVVTVTAAGPSAMRVETAVPVRDCRRMAMFFGRDAASLGLQVMEAKDARVGIWRRFFDGSQPALTEARPAEAACGSAPQTILAMVFRLR